MFKILLLTLLLNFTPAHADDLPPELSGLDFLDVALPTEDKATVNLKKSRQNSIIPFIQSSLPKSTVKTITKNLSEPEQIFCYHVAKRPADYEGYQIDNFAIVDYCGELDVSQTATTYEALFAQSPNIITAKAECTIVPKVLLRFVRGVDYTDVLLSSPCPSFTIFYAGRLKSFNVKQGVIDDVIGQFDKNATDFYSPAYLKQTKANGEATSDQEAEKYEKQRRENAPIMNWQNDNSQDETPKEKAPQKKGWGHIKLNM